MGTNWWLVAGGSLSAVAALLHLAIIAGGPAWYRFFGAGEGMARAAAAGSLRPALITIGIATVLGIWSAYAFSGAGLIPRLPLLKLGLIVIAAIYLLRGLAALPVALFVPAQADAFLWWSSAIVLIIGIAYAAGTWRAWATL